MKQLRSSKHTKKGLWKRSLAILLAVIALCSALAVNASATYYVSVGDTGYVRFTDGMAVVRATSSNTSVMTVTSSGYWTARGVGTATLTAYDRNNAWATATYVVSYGGGGSSGGYDIDVSWLGDVFGWLVDILLVPFEFLWDVLIEIMYYIALPFVWVFSLF
ncbi:MAG: hypothetical protein LBR73_04895 [Oscillospiraceae bacterium]|jgi:hypothetical protein|nr:hypothetical protein [Oscillospiraceae bacterium]